MFLCTSCNVIACIIDVLLTLFPYRHMYMFPGDMRLKVLIWVSRVKLENPVIRKFLLSF